MKKIIKKIIICAFFLTTAKVVSAKTCTDIYYSPPMPALYGYSRTDTYKLQTSASACKGSNTQVYFGRLEYWTAQGNVGQIFVDLMEEDPEGNDNEKVKSYNLQYYPDGYLNNVVVTTHITGNIDSEGDQTCELYLRMNASGYQGQTIQANLFTYYLCMI